MRAHYETAVQQREAEAASTQGKLSELQMELDQKENDLASQKQRQALATKYQERLRHLTLTLILTLTLALTLTPTVTRTLTEYQERLRHLSDEIRGLKKRQKEYATLERENRDRCREISALQGQIDQMKKAKVSLQRKQTEEGAQFREWKASRLREITQLRREARRNALTLTNPNPNQP